MDVRVEKISERLLLVDLEPLNAPGWIATYVIVSRRSPAIAARPQSIPGQPVGARRRP